MILENPVLELFLALLITLPVAVSVARVASSKPVPGLFARLFAESLQRGMVMVILALGVLVIIRQTGINQLILGLEKGPLASLGTLARLPGLALSAFIEEATKLLVLSMFLPGLDRFWPRHEPGTLPPRQDYLSSDERSQQSAQGSLEARVLAAQGAGFVFGMVESLMFAANSLPLFMSRTPGALLLHLCTAGILARSRQSGNSLRGLLFTVTIHALYNLSLLVGGLWTLGALIMLGAGLYKLLFVKKVVTEAGTYAHREP